MGIRDFLKLSVPLVLTGAALALAASAQEEGFGGFSGSGVEPRPAPARPAARQAPAAPATPAPATPAPEPEPAIADGVWEAPRRAASEWYGTGILSDGMLELRLRSGFDPGRTYRCEGRVAHDGAFGCYIRYVYEHRQHVAQVSGRFPDLRIAGYGSGPMTFRRKE